MRVWKDDLLVGCIVKQQSRKYRLLLVKSLCKLQSLKCKNLDEQSSDSSVSSTSSSRNFHSKITHIGTHLRINEHGGELSVERRKGF